MTTDLQKPKFLSLSPRDKNAIQAVTRHHVTGFRYEFSVNSTGRVWLMCPGTTSANQFSDCNRNDRLSIEKYLSDLAMFTVVRLIKLRRLDTLNRNINVQPCATFPKGGILNLWELIELNCGYTLIHLKELYS